MSSSDETGPMYSLEFHGSPRTPGAMFIIDQLVLRHFDPTNDRYIQMEQVADRIAPWRSETTVRIMRPDEEENFWKKYEPSDYLGSLPGGPIMHIERRRYLED